MTFLTTFDKTERKGLWKLLLNFILVAFPVAMLLMEAALLTLGRMGSVWWFYPFASWVIYHVGSWIHLPGIVAIVLWMLIPIAALLFTWAANSGAFGFRRGLLFTIFSICVAVGLLAGLCILLQACKVLYWYAAAGVLAVLVFAIFPFIMLAYNEKDGGKTSDGTRIILYWWENPGCAGTVLAVIISYLILHFWFKVL